MLPYIFVLLIGILCSIFSGDSRARQVYFCGVLLTLMTLVSGFRSLDFNIDTRNYIQAFYANKGEPHLEYLFYKSQELIRHPHLWLLFISSLIYIPLFFELKSEVKYSCLAAFVYLTSSSKFFTESFNIIRQSVAATFILGCFIYRQKNETLKSIFLLIVAILFHSSSVIVLPFLFIKKWVLKWKISSILLLGTFFIGLFGVFTSLISDTIVGITEFGSIASGNLAETLNRYSAYGGNGVGFNRNFIIATCFPLTALGIVTFPNSKVKKRAYNYYYSIFVISTCIGNIIIPATQFGFRLIFSLSIVQLLVFSLCYQYSSKTIKWILIGYLILSSLLFLYTLPNVIPPYKY